jgi:hypothetical protein
MPIRFRCAYCNQLLGIARRKSGTVVRCPTCAGQVVVPSMDEVPADEPVAPAPAPAPAPGPSVIPAPAPAVAPAASGGKYFEGSEIDKLLEGAAGDQPAALASVGKETMRPASLAPAPMPGPVVAVAPTGYAGARQPGVWLSPAKATLLSVLAVVALAVTFGAGLLVGLFISRR